MIVVATLLSGLLGISLGALGGGGSVLALPLLVYVAGLSPAAAAGVSLFIVGITALIATAMHARRGDICFRTAALFGGAGIPSAYLGAHFSNVVAPQVLLGAFAFLALGVAAWMGFGRVPRPRPAQSWPVIATIGALVGLVSGFFGVGGGFLIVPALTGLAGVDTRRAIGTSLLVIALNSTGGMVQHLHHLTIPLSSGLAFTGAATAGALAGQGLTRGLSVTQLRRAFALLVLVVACLILWRVLTAL